MTTKDFNGKGECHAVLVKLWKEEVEKDPTFASRIGITTDMSADRKIQEAYASRTINPLSTTDGKSHWRIG